MSLMLKRFVSLGAAVAAALLVALPVAAAENGRVTVQPGDMEGWAFVNDNHKGGSGKMVFGPAGQPFGKGSAELTLTSTLDGWALASGNHEGTRIANITALDYWTYTRNSNAIALQLTINNPSYHRLVYEPGSHGNLPAVNPKHWQQWHPTAAASRWWVTRSTVCGQNTPGCTWGQVKAMFPNATIAGGVWLKAGSGWSANKYNVDGFHFAATSPRTHVLYDFEPCEDSEHNNGHEHDC
jgi:hypothetical protein